MILREDEFNPGLTHPFYFIRKGLNRSVKELAPQLSGRLLDFGCGSKPYKAFFNVKEYVGVDYYNEGHAHDNEEIEFFYDGKTLPFKNEEFDAALCSEVFEHVFNLEEILKELNRVLKPGAKMLFTCPFVWNEHEVPYDYARYTRFALTDLMNRNGFEVIEQRKTGSFVETIFQMRVLYNQTVFSKACSKPPLRWFYKFFLIFLPNVLGVLANKILPQNDSLYLSNVFLVKKRG